MWRQDNENNDLKRIIDEMKIKLYQAAEKDNEITRLKQLIVACREEWSRLTEAYEGLVLDIKSQLSINDGLRAFIYELQMKIENHNNQVINLDQAIKEQIENLARHSLQKKVIEYNPNREIIIKSQNEIEAVRSKLGRIQAQNLTKSHIFGENTNNLNLIQFGQTRNFWDFNQQAPIETINSHTHPVTAVPSNNLLNVQANFPQSVNASINFGTNVLNTSGGISQDHQNHFISVQNPINQQKRSSNESIIKEIEALSKDKAKSTNNEESSRILTDNQ